MDYTAAQSACNRYRRAHRRLMTQEPRNHEAIVSLWSCLRAEFESQHWPLPDMWRVWSNAADDSARALHRARVSAGR